MLGPLPKLYRAVVASTAVLLFAGLGAWLTLTLPLQMLTSAGAALGVAVGALAVLALLHEPSAAPSRSRPVGLRHRPH
ncbi:hypothetical protein [Nocardioides mesophilus]|uniref:Uncharacterized protein n=1 Tax=Nocardioides mesophilus TaxID=433659 RepID=A0A7G9R9E9_9ACTN|nr:hypothetical protein [Nocardioides mesophilus]QNN52224.1 hypothetical protein H9L09_17290 [Nocardioides mesophilus]